MDLLRIYELTPAYYRFIRELPASIDAMSAAERDETNNGGMETIT